MTPAEVFDELSKSLQRSLQVESWARKSDKQSDSSCIHFLYTLFPVQVEKRWVVSNFDCIIYSRIWQLKSAICNSTKVVSASEWMQSMMGSDELSNIISNFYDDSRQIHFTFEMWIHGTVSFNNNLRRLIVFIDQSVVMRFLSLRVGVQGREPLTVALKAEVRQFLKSLQHYSHNYYSQMETGVIPKDVSQDAAGCITGLRSTGHVADEPFWVLVLFGISGETVPTNDLVALAVSTPDTPLFMKQKFFIYWNKILISKLYA